MTGIIPFDFETNGVRVVMEDDAPWFVAVDICRALEIKNSSQAVARLSEERKRLVSLNTVGSNDGIPHNTLISNEGIRGNPNAVAVNQGGLFDLIFTSRKPSARRFAEWVTGEVLPTLLRDGSYTMPGLDAADAADLEAKRAYHADLRPEHKEIAARRAAAVAAVDARIADDPMVGRVTRAVRAVAAEFEVSESTLWGWRKQVYMVARPDHDAALAPKWSGKRGVQVECHPEAERMFLDGVQRGRRVSDSYHRMLVTAIRNDWEPIPSYQTMRRRAKHLLAPARNTPTQTIRSA